MNFSILRYWINVLGTLCFLGFSIYVSSYVVYYFILPKYFLRFHYDSVSLYPPIIRGICLETKSKRDGYQNSPLPKIFIKIDSVEFHLKIFQYVGIFTSISKHHPDPAPSNLLLRIIVCGFLVDFADFSMKEILDPPLTRNLGNRLGYSKHGTKCWQFLLRLNSKTFSSY